MPRILVVDDDAALVETLTAVFGYEPGVRVYAAHSGEEAVKAAVEHRPDLVVLDIALPGRDGLSVLQSLKEDTRTADAKVIMMTGIQGSALETSGKAMGVDACFRKPFSSLALLDKASQLLKVDETAELAETAR